jgi:polyhydroxyalkanoate synthesis regulator phasin
MSIQEIIQSKLFSSLTTGIFFVLIYKLYLYIKELKARYEYSDKLRDVVNNYMKKGKMTTAEFTGLLRLVREMCNYMGLYHESFEKLTENFGDHGDLDYGNNVFNENSNLNESQQNELKQRINYLEKQLESKNNKDLIIHENEKENPF